jgi:hypothetical protein
MSQRQKRTRVHRGTQTEECYFVDPLPDIGEEGDYRELHERLLKAEEVNINQWCLLLLYHADNTLRYFSRNTILNKVLFLKYMYDDISTKKLVVQPLHKKSVLHYFKRNVNGGAGDLILK